MRIITRGLGIAGGGCLLALFFYLVLALPGVLSDQDGIAARATMHVAQRSQSAARV